MPPRARRARVEDVHDLARAMPHVTVVKGPASNPVYQVGGKSFIFFRTPRPDAVDPDTGERYADVIVLWVESEADKEALVLDPETPLTLELLDSNKPALFRNEGGSYLYGVVPLAVKGKEG